MRLISFVGCFTLAARLAVGEDPAVGAKLFSASCAKCHNMDGSKALEAGLPLRERAISDADMEVQVVGRMDETATKAEKVALMAYVRTITKRPKP